MSKIGTFPSFECQPLVDLCAVLGAGFQGIQRPGYHGLLNPQYTGRLLDQGCFASGPHEGQKQNNSGHGTDFGQPVPLHLPSTAPLD
jgi:hypothetical protein